MPAWLGSGKWKWKLVAESCLTLQFHGLQPVLPLCPWFYPGKSTGVVCHFLLQTGFWGQLSFWFADSLLAVGSQGLSLVCALGEREKACSYKVTNPIGLGPHPNGFIELQLFKSPISKYGLPCWLRLVKNLTAVRGTQDRSLGQEDPLEKGMPTHSRILAWKIPWTEEPGGLQSMGLQRLRHNWATNTNTSKNTVILRVKALTWI